MMVFSKSLTETIISKNSQNLEINPETRYVNEKFQVIVECYILLES